MLETEFLKLKYHANVESNTDEVDAEEYFNKNYFIIDANAKKNYEDLVKIKEDLEQENTELSSNLPWNTIQGKSLHITDSAKYSKNKLSISGDMEQEKRSGYNLFDYINKVKKGTNYGVTITTDDEGYIIANGTIQDSYKSLVVPYSIDNILEDTETYTVWQEKHSSGLDGIYVQLKLVNKSTQAETFVYASNVNRKVVVDKNTYNYYINIQWATAEQVFSNYKNRYMLLKGDYTSTSIDYEQYGATPSTEFPSMPVVCTGVQKIRQSGKNIFDVNDKISTYTVDEEDWISVSKNNSAGSTASYTNIYTNKSSNLKVNTEYSIVAEIKQVTGEGYIRFVSDASASGFSQFSQEANYNLSNLKSGDIIILKRTSKSDFSNCSIMLRTFLTTSAGKSNSITFRLSVLEDTNITVNNFVYEPYWEQIHTLNLGTTEICAIKDTNGNIVAKDRGVFRNGKWQWEKKIKKRVLNGTENWYKSGNSANVSYGTSNAINDIDTSTITPEANKKIVAKAVCNYFPTVSLSTMFSNTEGFALDVLSNSIIELRLGFGLDTEITTVALLKEWLAQKYAEGNPVIVYYILKTPVYEDCTAEQSAVLDKLYNNFELSKGTNNIIVESENGVGVNLELEYMQDNILKDKKLEDRVTALENLLSTTQTSALLLDNLQNDLESEV